MIHEEIEEYYVGLVKKYKATRKRFGLTVSYDMGWQRWSRGNNYTSLSGHEFLIGVHTRQIIVCAVFSKKCIFCENRRKKGSVRKISSTVLPTSLSLTEVTPSVSAMSPSVTIDDPSVSIIQPNMSAHDVEQAVANDVIVEETDTGVIDVSNLDHPCTRNYDNSSGTMKSYGLLLLIKNIQKKYKGEIFLVWCNWWRYTIEEIHVTCKIQT